MGEQLADGDDRLAAIDELRPEIGQEARHRIIQAKDAGLGERERRGGDQRLGDGGEAEDRVFRRAASSLAVRMAGRAAVDELAVFGDQHDRADDNAVADRCIDHGVEPGGALVLGGGSCGVDGGHEELRAESGPTE